MNAAIEPEGQEQGQTDMVFRHVMAAITEQACAEGREGDVMEGLFPVVFVGVGDDDGEDLGL
jgi:hypothetical protein